MNSLVLTVIAIGTLLTAEARAELRLVLKSQDLKTLVQAKNERVRAKGKELEGASMREGSLVRSFLPTAEVYAGQEQFKKGPLSSRSQPTYGAEVRLNLFNGGRDKLENDRRSIVSQRKRYEVAQTVAEELSKAREAYWRILYLRDYIELIKDARKSSAESLKAAERRIRSGVATVTDRVEFEMQDIDLKRELERAELEQKNQIRTLMVVLGLDYNTVIEFPETFKHEHDWEVALKHTEEDHAFLVKPAELHAKESEAQASIQRRSWLPKVDAFAAYNQFNQREEEDFADASDRQESVIGVRLTMSLFDGLSGYREAAALSSEAEAALSEARYASQEVEAHLHGEIAELRLLHNQVHAAEENIKRAERYHQLTKSEYSRGVKNSPDMLGATEKLISMRQKRLEIVRDFQIAKSHVLAKLGR